MATETKEKRKKYTDAQIWDAVVDVMSKDPRPLEVWRVATAANMTESDVMTALIRETGPRRKSVRFRYPSLPCPAIESIGD